MKKKKLLILINNIDGGTGTFLNQLSKLPGFIDNELEISVLALQKGKNTPLSNFSYISYYSNSRTRDKYNASVSELFNIIKELWWLGKEVKKIRPDVILSIDTHCNLLASIAKKIVFRKIRLIITNHNNVEEIVKISLSTSAENTLKAMCRYFFPVADVIVCNSKGISNSFGRYFAIPQKIQTINYGVDARLANYLSGKAINRGDKIFFSKNNKTIVSIGRFEYQKDFETLIRAVSIASKDMGSMRLLIIGDGSERNKVELLIGKLKLKNKVFLLGWHRNIYPYLKRADLFVLSSRYEGFGYVLLEAMSQKVPIIATDSPFGPAEVLENGRYGILVPKENVGALTEAIRRVILDKKLSERLSKLGQKRLKDYPENKMLRAYYGLIKGVSVDK